MNELNAYKKQTRLVSTDPKIIVDVFKYLEAAVSMKEYDKLRKAIFHIMDYIKIEQDANAAELARILIFINDNAEKEDPIKILNILKTLKSIFE